MEVSLPSGGTATFRDQFKGNDYMDALKASQLVRSPDGSITVDSAIQARMCNRIIRRTLVAWPFGVVPSEAQSDDLAERMMGELDIDDLLTLHKAVGPWVEKVMSRDRVSVRHLATGVLFELPADPGEAAKVRASGDFQVIGDEAGPKPASTPTAITSSAGPAPGGLPTET